MKKLILLISVIILLCFISKISIAQKQGNIWYFGNHAGLDFNTGAPIALTNGQTAFFNCNSHNEGSSVISDSSGSLLFYCDGQTVWNRNHQIMPNGNGLLGNISSTQSSIIVPQPLSDRYFYVFTTDAFTCGSNLSNGFRYSVLDICAGNKMGDIIPDKKNILLVDTVSEKLAVTRHANGIDYWIVTHKFFSNKFYAFLLTSNGIADTVISAIGSVHNGNISHSIGQLKFSPNGQKLAIGTLNGLDILDIFEFNKTTGIISNYKSLLKPNNNYAGIYGVEFSSDNTKLYAHGQFSLGLSSPFLAQYDLSSGGGNIDSINASLTIIHKDTLPPFLSSPRGLQIGPDNKIYFVSNKDQGKLAVIQNPNIYGVGCNFHDSLISLASMTGSFSLTSFIAGYEYSNTKLDCDVGIEEHNRNSEIIIHPNPANNNIIIDLPQKSEIEILNFNGQIIKRIKIAEKQINIDITDIERGMYFVKAITLKEIIIIKFIKE